MHSLSLRSWNGELNTSSKLVLSIRDIPIHATEVVRLSSATVNFFSRGDSERSVVACQARAGTDVTCSNSQVH